MPRNVAIAHLYKKYAESPVAEGLAADGNIIEVLSSKSGETFTIIVSFPNGQSCLVATGGSWGVVPVIAKGESM